MNWKIENKIISGAKKCAINFEVNVSIQEHCVLNDGSGFVRGHRDAVESHN